MFYGILIGLGCACLIHNIIVLIWAIKSEDDDIIVNTMVNTSLVFILATVYKFLFFYCRAKLYKVLCKNNNVLIYDNETSLPKQITREQFNALTKKEWNNLRLNYYYRGYGECCEPFRNNKKSHKYWNKMSFITDDFRYCPKRVLKQFEMYKGL